MVSYHKEEEHITHHVVLDGWACDLAIVEHFKSLETMTGCDVCEAFVCDLHTAVQLQDCQVLRNRCAGTQAANTFVRDAATIRHALLTHANTYMQLVTGSTVKHYILAAS